jgi:hypothetical protein
MPGKRRRGAGSRRKSKFSPQPVPHPQLAGRRVAFAWYDAQQWARLREIAADPEVLNHTYEDWLKQAEEAVAALRARGVRAEKLPIDVDAAASWSAARGRPFNMSARAEYVAELARQLTKDKG